MKTILPLIFGVSIQASHTLRHFHSGFITGSSLASSPTENYHVLQATATSDCKKYTVKSGDTCASIGKSTGVTWAQLISWNSDINSQCSNLQSLANQTICVSNPMGDYAMPTNTADGGGADMSGIVSGTGSLVTTKAPVPSPTLDGTNSRCGQYYKIGTNETCQDVEEKFRISLSDFVFLNPEVFTNCTNLELAVYYCVKPVGQISTYSGYGGSSTEEWTTVPMTSVPFPTGKYTTGGSPAIPIAEDTRKDCTDYIWFGAFEYPIQRLALDCWSLAQFYDISPEEFILWNPSMAKNSTLGSSSRAVDSGIPSPTAISSALPSSYNYPCTISQSMSYCVAISTPTSTADA